MGISDSRARARLRPPDRERHAGRGAARPGRDRGLPRDAHEDAAWHSARARRTSRRATATSRRCTASRSRVDEGEVVAVLGANGAGKTTTLRAISGHRRARPARSPSPAGAIARRPPEASPAPGSRTSRKAAAPSASSRCCENLRLGAYPQRDGVDEGYERVFALLPVARGAPQPAGRARSRGGEQQMLALAPRADGAAAAAAARRAVARARAARRPRDLRASSPAQRGGRARRARRRAERDARARRSPRAPTCSRSGRVALEGASAELRENESVRRSYLGYLMATPSPGRLPAAGRQRARVGRDLREPRARDRDHLPLDRRRQLRAGRDGDVHDVHRLDADATTASRYWPGVRAHAR